MPQSSCYYIIKVAAWSAGGVTLRNNYFNVVENKQVSFVIILIFYDLFIYLFIYLFQLQLHIQMLLANGSFYVNSTGENGHVRFRQKFMQNRIEHEKLA